jgi:hypothetical protein
MGNKKLPRFAKLIQSALDSYECYNSMQNNITKLKDFADYMMSEIKK